ncbi:uncharacterized protein LOC135486211 [Lineus longissimus]|uniref:uncharacterized protein LOC135486211 n=1 Tax=Lineus longissimus TaxID=88925 RepID=UPI002B4D83F2
MPRAKPKKEKLQETVPEVKPVSRTGNIANEQATAIVEKQQQKYTSRRTGKKFEEPEGVVESVVIDEEISFRRASLGVYGFSEEIERNSPETVVEKETSAEPDVAKVVGAKARGRSVRKSRKKGLEDLEVGDGGVTRSTGAKKMKKDVTMVQNDIDNEENVEVDEIEKCIVKSGSNTNKLSRIGNLRAKVKKSALGQNFFEVDAECDIEDSEGVGKEGTTNGNVCVSPDIDQACEPSAASHSQKTGQGVKDVWESIVKTTRKDPRAQKLSYKKIKIDQKGSKNTGTGSQPGESGKSLASPLSLSEDTNGLFTGIRTYSRKNLSEWKKNSTGNDESVEEILSLQGQNLTESNKAEESEVGDVVEKTSEEVVGKQGVKSRRKGGPKSKEVVDHNDIDGLGNLAVVREAAVCNSDIIENSDELAKIVDGPEVETLSPKVRKTARKGANARKNTRKIDAEPEDENENQVEAVESLDPDLKESSSHSGETSRKGVKGSMAGTLKKESAEATETEGKQSGPTRKSGRLRKTGRKAETKPEVCLDQVDDSSEGAQIEGRPKHLSEAMKKNGRSNKAVCKAEIELKDTPSVDNASIDKMDGEESCEVVKTESLHLHLQTTKKSGRMKRTSKTVEAEQSEAPPIEDACLDKMDIEESAGGTVSEDKHQSDATRKGGRSRKTGRKAATSLEDTPSVQAVDEMNVQELVKAAETESSLSLGIENTREGGRSRKGGKKPETKLKIVQPIDDACMDGMDVQKAAATEEVTVIKMPHPNGVDAKSESGNPVTSNGCGEVVAGLVDYLESADKMLEKVDLSLTVETSISSGKSGPCRKSDGTVDAEPKVTVHEDSKEKDDTFERLAEDEWIAEVGALPALSAEAAGPDNSSPCEPMTEDKSGCSEENDQDDSKLGDLDDTLPLRVPVPDNLNDDDGIPESSAVVLKRSCANGEGNEEESGQPRRKTAKKTNTDSDSTKVMKDASPRVEEQTAEMDTVVSEVKTGQSDCAETAEKSGRSRRKGKNAAREIVDAPPVKNDQERSEWKSTPADSAGITRKGVRSTRKGRKTDKEIEDGCLEPVDERAEIGSHEPEVKSSPTDSPENKSKDAESRRNERKCDGEVEATPLVSEELGEVNVSQQPDKESKENTISMENASPTLEEQMEGMAMQVSEVAVAVMNCGPSADERIVRKSGRRGKKGKKTDNLKDADNVPGEQMESMDTESVEQAITVQTEVTAAVTATGETGGRSRKSTRQSAKKPVTNNNQEVGDLKSNASDEIIDKVEDAVSGQGEEIEPTIGQEMAVEAEVDCTPLTGKESVKKSGRVRKKPKKNLEEQADVVTSPLKELDEQEKALAKSCPPGEEVRRSGRSRKNDEKVKEIVEERSQVRDEHDKEACHQETVDVVASETTPPKSDEDVQRSRRTRKNGGEAKYALPGEAKMEDQDKTAGVDADQIQKIRKSGRSRKKDGKQEGLSVPADLVENPKEGKDIQEAAEVDQSEVIAVGRGKRLQKNSVEAKEKTNGIETPEVLETDVKGPLEAAEIEIAKSLCQVVDDNNNETLKHVAMDVVETVEKAVQEDIHCVDSKRKGRKNIRRQDLKEQSQLASAADDLSLGVEKMVAVTAQSTVSNSGFCNDIQTIKKSSRSRKKGGKAAREPPRSELPIIDETERTMSAGDAEEDGRTGVASDASEVGLREVVPGKQDFPQDQVPSLVENLTSDLNKRESVALEAECQIQNVQGGTIEDQCQPAEVKSSGIQSKSEVLHLQGPPVVQSSNLVTKVSSAGVATYFPTIVNISSCDLQTPLSDVHSVTEGVTEVKLPDVPSEEAVKLRHEGPVASPFMMARKQHIKTQPITPLVQVPILTIKNEPITPVIPIGINVMGTVQNVKKEPITPSFPAQQQSVFSAGENLKKEAILPNVAAQQLRQELFSSDHVCDKEVEGLNDVGLALHGNGKRRLMSEDDMSPAESLKEYQSGFWDVVDGNSERVESSTLDVTVDELDLNGNNVTDLKDAVEVEADVHAEVDGTTATVVPPSDGLDSSKSCDRLRKVIGSMATTDRDAVDEIMEEDLPVQAGGRKRGGNRGKATKRKPNEEEVKEVRKSKRNKKFEEEDAEPGGSGSIEAKPTRCYKIGPSRKEDMYVGAHVSISGGLHKAVANAVEVGARSFGLFLRSQRQWSVKPILDETAQKFRKACKDHHFPPHLILPHGSYLMNLGSPKPDLLQKSRDLLVEELSRCEQLGLELFNFHPGSTVGETSVEDSILKIAESIDWAHSKTKYCKTVIENMSCQGHTIGGKFCELRAIIDLVKDKSRIGVCLDTCHAMAAGYDLGTEKGFNRMMDDFTSIVGLDYLVGVHLNDSRGEAGCHKDRHENIGQGQIGRAGFRRIMNDARFHNLPMILETPADIDDVIEIELLYMMCKNN